MGQGDGQDPQRRKCVARVKNGPRKGQRCNMWARRGATCCRAHLTNPKAIRNAAVRAEVESWGFADETEDPGEILLRLVTQSSQRVRRYSALLAEAHQAADNLRDALEHQRVLIADVGDVPGETWEDRREDKGGFREENPAVQAARADLERIFTTGGVAALIGNTYSSTNSGHVFATGEMIRGLARLEAEERDRCARFAKLAIDAGIAERQVRMAERQGQLVEKILLGVLGELGLDDDQLDLVPDLIERQLELVAG